MLNEDSCSAGMEQAINKEIYTYTRCVFNTLPIFYFNMSLVDYVMMKMNEKQHIAKEAFCMALEEFQQQIIIKQIYYLTVFFYPQFLVLQCCCNSVPL